MDTTEILNAIKGKDEETKSEYSNDNFDYEEFIEYLKGDISPNSIVQYSRYLHQVDFELTERNIENFQKVAKKQAKRRFGKSEEERNSRNRFIYNLYLAVDKYLKATDRKNLAEKLPDSSQLKKPKSRPQKIRYSEDQVNKIMDTADERKTKLSIALMFYSGLRTYEVLHLTPEWLEFKEDRIEVEIPSKYAKGRKSNPRSEKAYLQTEYEDELQSYIKDCYNYEGSYQQLYQKLETQGSFRHVFRQKEERNNHFLDIAEERHIFNKKLEKAARKAGINEADKISAHKLRKSFIHHVYDKIQDLNRTAHLARHRNPQVTARNYLKLNEQKKLEDYQKVFSQEQ
ncbi:MAG: tyrosine-type recombinase/integrase [Candidatus Nanohaloarchaea archaeon]